MTRLTAMLLQEDPKVYASSYGPIDGKYSLYVGTIDEAPSGFERPRDLLTSQPIYATAEEAEAAAEKVIRDVCHGARSERDLTCAAIIVATQDLYFSALYNQDCLLVLNEIQLMDDVLATSTQLTVFRDQ
jgi:hypothetical protein